MHDQAIPNIVRIFLSIPRLLAFLKPDPNDVTPPSLAHGIRPNGIPSGPSPSRIPSGPSPSLPTKPVASPRVNTSREAAAVLAGASKAGAPALICVSG